MASGPFNGQPTAANPRLHFYPAYCNKASPTYFTWVKLTASDIHHALRSRPGFVSHNNSISYQRPQSHDPTSLLFYLNHPIQFICLTGVVVAFDDYDRCWVFTVDDSSGATIDVTCRKPEKVEEQKEEKSAQQNGHSALTLAATAKAGWKKDDKVKGEANAVVEMLSRIDVGSVVKVKGTIGSFRSVRQIALERLEIFPDTNAEVRFWVQRTQLFADVLSKPWTLSAEEQKRLLEEAEGDAENTRGRAAKRNERLAKEQRREKRHAKKIAHAYEVEERERERVAEETRQDGLRLGVELDERERERVAEETRQDGLRLGVELDEREQERTVKKVKREKSAQLGKSGFRNGRVTNLRELVSSK